MSEVFEWLDNFIESASDDNSSDVDIYTEDGVISKIGEFFQRCIDKIREIFKRISMKLREISCRALLKTTKNVNTILLMPVHDFGAAKKYVTDIRKLMMNTQIALDKAYSSYKPGKNADEVISRMISIAAKCDADTRALMTKHNEVLKKTTKEEKTSIKTVIENTENMLKEYHNEYNKVMEADLKKLQQFKRMPETNPEIEKVARAYASTCMSMFGKHSSVVYGLSNTYFNEMQKYVNYYYGVINDQLTDDQRRIANDMAIQAHNQMRMMHDQAVQAHNIGTFGHV